SSARRRKAGGPMAGSNLTCGGPTPPSRLTSCGLSRAVSVIDSVAFRAPVAVGMSRTAIAQETPNARVWPAQASSATTKSVAFVPPIVLGDTVSGVQPTLRTATLRFDGVPRGTTPRAVHSYDYGVGPAGDLTWTTHR